MQKNLWIGVSGVTLAMLVMGGSVVHAGTDRHKQAKGVPQRIQQLQNEVNYLESTVQNLQSSVGNQSSQISTLNSTLSRQQTTINQLNSTVTQQSQEIQSDQSKIGQNASNIATLSSKVGALQNAIQQLQPSPGQTGSGSGTSQTGGYSVSGSIVDAHNTPFYAAIYLENSSGAQYHLQQAPANGVFTFTNIPDGVYSVHFDMSAEYQVTSPQSVTVDGANVSHLLIHCANVTYTISGVAQYTNGAPITNQPVSIGDTNNITGWGITTSSNGTFAIPGVPNGSYTIYIGPPNAPIASSAVTVSNGNVSSLTITQ